jgi:exonuclease SbcC
LNMYSGGETVRIVFAILLSLSNLLTKRAGKRSQTLIIDERVAALDTEGINQFIEIVKYISDKYKKILIVSHISELNEAFANVILVNKSETEGSKVSYKFTA